MFAEISEICEYAWGLNMGGGIGGVLNLRQGGQNYAYLYDGKGNVSAMLDGSQAVVATYTYDAFGTLMSETGSLSQPFKFSTKLYDEQTGLSYFGYRFYSPVLGRWLTQDPIGYEGGLNLYGYVANEPISRIDPSGLLFEKIWNDPNERAQHMDQAITMSKFIRYTHGKSLCEVQREMDVRRWHMAASAGGPRERYRYVVNPNNPSEVLDMRHFLVVGEQGELFGLGVEIFQLGTESSFDAQDFLSNSLGADFFKTYDYQWPRPPLDTALLQFFSKGK